MRSVRARAWVLHQCRPTYCRPDHVASTPTSTHTESPVRTSRSASCTSCSLCCLFVVCRSQHPAWGDDEIHVYREPFSRPDSKRKTTTAVPPQKFPVLTARVPLPWYVVEVKASLFRPLRFSDSSFSIVNGFASANDEDSFGILNSPAFQNCLHRPLIRSRSRLREPLAKTRV
jgi:hypothetical protein